MLFPNAPRSIKFASGENPKRTYGSRDETPSTRMGNFEVMRQAFEEARVYRRDWDDYEASISRGETDVAVPQRDLKLEALADILRGKLLVQIHVYRSDEMLTEMEIAHEYGYKIRAFHHALEAYKIADKIAASGVAIATFADWYGYKEEAWDAIPWNAVICMRKGIRVALKSDSTDHIRRLNQEAGKMVRYGGATEDEALRMITLNPAWIIGVEDRVGSLDVGKDADLVVWDHDPLSVYARAEKVYIDGELFFSSAAQGLGATHFHGVMTDSSRGGSDE
jgi:imidazolonepropionase-like amidohydrolase